jgi:hypothetical protein
VLRVLQQECLELHGFSQRAENKKRQKGPPRLTD